MRNLLPGFVRRRLARASHDAGYVAVMIGILLPVLLGFCAFAVDVGNWYFTGQRVQRAADAAALAGVPSLPGSPATAYQVARDQAGRNNFGASATTVVTPALDGRPTRLRVSINTTVQNQFGWLLGVPTTTITKTAVADYAGPVPMGSPCNTFGDDPDSGGIKTGSACGSVGQFWANVNAKATQKAQGDPFQASVCDNAWGGCSGSTNPEYDANGYFYTVNVANSGMSKLTIELFDPAFVNTGTGCDTNFGSSSTASTKATNDFVTDPTTRYVSGSGKYCVGDYYPGSGTKSPMTTEFTVRSPSASTWDALSFPVVNTVKCQPKAYYGYDGSLYNVLNKGSGGYDANIAEGFRRWTTLCTIDNPVKGDYLIQVKTNGQTNKAGSSTDGVIGSNHFSIRAYGTSNGDADALSVSGREKMSMDSNKPGAKASFYLARVPTGAAGQMLTVNLWDVGDSNQNGTIRFVSPGGTGYLGCTGSGVTTFIGLDCSFAATSAFNGQWQTVNIPIPSNYECTDTDPADCWVKLVYDYGANASPTDVTTWTANIQGDPVRLVE